MAVPVTHPEWWIRHLEALEALDEPHGAPFGAGTELEAAVVDALWRRGCVVTQAAPVLNERGKEIATVPWARLTELGRRVFEEDLPPPPFIRQSGLLAPTEAPATAPDDPSTARSDAHPY